jgi:SOS regulatory protein LexA
VLDLKPGASRGIQLRDSLREQLGLPLIGRVAAGKPILAEENIETHYRVDPQIFSPRAHYLLKVRGMSMKGAGILDGDLVAVHRTPEVRNRQIIVARLENEVTVKRYKQDGSVVWLMPENDDFEPMRVDLKEESLIIEGSSSVSCGRTPRTPDAKRSFVQSPVSPLQSPSACPRSMNCCGIRTCGARVKCNPRRKCAGCRAVMRRSIVVCLEGAGRNKG